MNIYQKLLNIQKQVKGLKKDKKAFGYEYVTGGKLLSFLKPIMEKEGLLLKQEIISIDNTRQDYTVSAKKWVKNSEGKNEQLEYERPKSEILSKVMMRFTWVCTDTGDKDENLFGANGQNGWDKGVGSALTYGERYFLLKYFHIPTDEDDIDNPELKPEPKQEQPKQEPSQPKPQPKPKQEQPKPKQEQEQSKPQPKQEPKGLTNNQYNKVLGLIDISTLAKYLKLEGLSKEHFNGITERINELINSK